MIALDGQNGTSSSHGGANGQPLVPIGLADPNAQPPYPQYKAEIMGGRIALSAQRSEIPRGLEEAVIGYATAAEIGW